MWEQRQVGRRNVLQSGLAAVLGLDLTADTETADRSVEYYANSEGYIDADGLAAAASDFREGVIGADLLNEVASYWRSGERVTTPGSVNPAQLIDAHTTTLGETNFRLGVEQFDSETAAGAGTLTETPPTKQLEFQWNDQQRQSLLDESTDADLAADVTQQFSSDEHRVDVTVDGDRINDATLPVDEGPLYVDGRTLLDALLIGAALSYDSDVTRNGQTLPRYVVDSHRRLENATGYVVGSDETYVAELQLEWQTDDGGTRAVTLQAEPGGTVAATGGTPQSVSISWGNAPEFNLVYGETINVSVTGWVSNPGTVRLKDISGFVSNTTIASEEVGSQWTGSSWNIEIGTDIDATPGDEIEFQATVEEDGYLGGSASTIARRVSVVEPTYVLDVTAGANGELAVDPPGVTTTDWAERYSDGTPVELTARPDTNYRFDRWTGDVPTGAETDRSIQVQMDRTRTLSATFEREEEINATVRSSDPEAGTFREGETVTTTARVENTGTVEHTFFVGYSLYDESGTEYTNNDQTGRPVTLTAGETTTVDLTWTVESTASPGMYDAVVAIWQESDRDNLQTRLDEDQTVDAFEVVETPPEYALTVETIGSGTVQLTPPGTTTAGTTETYEEGTDVDVVAEPAPGYTFDRWSGTLPIGEEADETLPITVDSDSTLTAEFVKTERTVEIESLTAGQSVYEPEETAEITATVTNTAGEPIDMVVEYDITGPGGETRTQTTTGTVPAGGTEPVTTEWTATTAAPAGSYDVTVRVSRDRDPTTAIAERTTEGIFEISTGTQTADLWLQTVDARGEPIDGVEVTLTPRDGADSRSNVSTSGEIHFEELDTGVYAVEAVSEQLHQTANREIAVKETQEVRRRVQFEPAEPVRGLVLDADDEQIVPDTTVSIPDLNQSVRTDDTGRFTFTDRIPDGEYEFQVIPDEGNETTTTETVDLTRTVVLNTPDSTPDPDEDASEVLAEENLFVSLVVRNIERTEISGAAVFPLIHQYGAAKGAATALLDFVEGLRDLLEMDLAEYIETLKELYRMVTDDPGVLKQMVVMMIEGIQEKQKEDNPFEPGTVNYRTFQTSWVIGFGVMTILIEFIIGKGAGQASRIARNSTRLKKGISSLRSQVPDAGDIPDSFALGSRKGQLNIGGKVTGPRIQGIIDKGTNPDAVKEIYTAYHELSRKTAQTIATPFSGVSDVADLDNQLGRIKGKLGELVAARKILRERERLGQLPATGSFSIVKSIPDNAPSGKTYLVNGWDDIEELDLLVVTKTIPDGGREPELRVHAMWEIKTGRDTSAGQAKSDLQDKLETIRREAETGESGNPGSGVPYIAFNRGNDIDLRTMGPTDNPDPDFDNTLPLSSTEFEADIRHMYENKEELGLE